MKTTETRRNSDSKDSRSGTGWRGKIVGRRCIILEVNSPKRTNVSPVTCGGEKRGNHGCFGKV
jgi:hypothetical protein